MQVTLVRHPEVSVEGLCYGQSNVPLVKFWKVSVAQNQLLGKLPESFKQFDMVISSPLHRCLEMARFLKTWCRIDPRFMEMNLGDWEMKQKKDLGDVNKYWVDHYLELAPPNGETFQDIKKRVKAALDEYKDKGYENICIFTHGGPILAARVLVGDIEETNTIMLDSLTGYAESVVIEY